MLCGLVFFFPYSQKPKVHIEYRSQMPEGFHFYVYVILCSLNNETSFGVGGLSNIWSRHRSPTLQNEFRHDTGLTK